MRSTALKVTETPRAAGREYFYRRSITLRAGIAEHVVYVVVPTSGEKPDPVPVIARFPAGWRPTENPGQCLAELGSGPAVFETSVLRSQFRHYERISRADALALYPELLR